jgi:glycosyltransferase involved in cell wall biosynthesis
MRIVIDLQGAQSQSRFRGIGRYTLSFAQAVARNRGEHEVILALSGLFPETIDPIRAAFDGLLPQENIRVWHAPGPIRAAQEGNNTRRKAAELIREYFLASLQPQPDVIHICSFFEGYGDDVVTSIGCFDTQTPVSVTLYDLIPLVNSDHYLKPYPRFAQFYKHQLAYLRKASCLLAISEFTRQEGLTHLEVTDNQIINVSGAIDSRFRLLTLDDATISRLRAKFGITRPFVLYTGGYDERKNLLRLIQAYAALPPTLRAGHQLVFAGKLEGNTVYLRQQAKSAGLRADELLFTDYLSDQELVQLYNLCKLYVFPSWHEGFGLPALEAMACGAPVIGSNTSSLPEIIGLKEALFDPFDVASVTAKMQQALTDETFRSRLREHGLKQAKRFSWDETAKRAYGAWLRLYQASNKVYRKPQDDYRRLCEAIAYRIGSSCKDSDLWQLAYCLALNHSAIP